MTDPVRCNSIEEIRSLREAHAQFQASLTSANADFEALAQLDKQIKSFNVGPNPYTWFTMEALTGRRWPGRWEARMGAAPPPAPPPWSRTPSVAPRGGWWSGPAGLGAAGRSSCFH